MLLIFMSQGKKLFRCLITILEKVLGAFINQGKENNVKY